MTTRLRCLIRTSTVALGTTLISLTGCGPSSNPATPSALSAGALYAMGGSTYRTIYQFKPIRAGNSYGPNGQLVAIGDVLYGTTQWGGHTGGPYGSGDGTVFSLTTSGRLDFLYRFKGGSDGDSPNGGLAYVDGILYGTTLDGGSGCPGRRGCGTVFAITPSGQEHLLYRFKGGSDGIAPNGSLLWFDSKLYGTTAGGGVTSPCRGSGSIPGCGTIFSIDTSGNERVIHRFHGYGDGASPNAGLLALGGKLYGTTSSGGAAGSCNYSCGTLFEVSTSGAEKVLHGFQGGNDGSTPGGALIAVDGVLYGTTNQSAAYGCLGGCGTVFKATTSGAESAIYRFKGPPDAGSPLGMLVVDRGLLYGTSWQGGDVCDGGYSESGTIFAVSTAGAEHVAHTYSCKGPNEPAPGLLSLHRVLYGTVSGGSSIFALTR
jgi:uncharacterized repeat protein (TIGR03803 family)